VSDRDMASVAMLRLKGKLDALLPQQLAATNHAGPRAQPPSPVGAYGARP